MHQVESFRLLLSGLESERVCPGKTKATEYYSLSASDLAQHLLKRCPNAQLLCLNEPFDIFSMATINFFGTKVWSSTFQVTRSQKAKQLALRSSLREGRKYDIVAPNLSIRATSLMKPLTSSYHSRAIRCLSQIKRLEAAFFFSFCL